MSLPRYPTYKDSRIEWVGDVPAHWRCVRNKVVFSEVDERSQTDDGELLTVSHITGVTPRSEKEVNMFLAETLEGYKKCCRGDVIINTMWAWMGALGCSPCDGLVSPSYNVYRPRPSSEILPAYYDHLCRIPSHRVSMKARSSGVWESRLRLYPAAFLDMWLPLPPVDEQAAIAAFLDRETAKIDALVAEQERLIELLREKRQAVISHAVTKGLNLDAPMKDSGIEWLGHVPAHWTVTCVGRVCADVADGPHFSPEYVDDGVLFLSARNIKVDGWALDDVKYVSEDDCREFDKRVVPAPGDVLYTKGGTTGVARVLDLKQRVQVWVHIAVLKLNSTVIEPHFMAYALNSVGCYEQSQLYTRGATNQDLGLTRMVKIRFALPPLDEQRLIVTVLDERVARLDRLIREAQCGIDLLQERRRALISAAVTGQIDVRSAVGPSP